MHPDHPNSSTVLQRLRDTNGINKVPVTEAAKPSIPMIHYFDARRSFCFDGVAVSVPASGYLQREQSPVEPDRPDEYCHAIAETLITGCQTSWLREEGREFARLLSEAKEEFGASDEGERQSLSEPSVPSIC